MTTIRQIVTDAFRETGLIQIGTAPEAEQFDEGLRKLQSIIISLYGNELGSPLSSVPYGTEGMVQAYAKAYDYSSALSSYFVPPNSQLVVNASNSYTVYLNPDPHDGERISIVDVGQNFDESYFTIDGNGRRIEGERTLTLTDAGAVRSWFYRADLGTWVVVSPLGADDESPFPPEFDEFLITSLAMRLHPRYQQQTAAETIEAWRRSKSQFRARYKQSKEMYPDIALVRLSSRYPTGAGFEGRGADNSFTVGDVVLDGGGATP